MSFQREDDVAGRQEPQPLTTLRAGTPSRVRRVASETPELLVKLSGFGVVPGAIVILQQRLPAAVVQIGETTVALDTEIAARILVEPV